MSVGARSETTGPAAGDAGGGPAASPPDAGRTAARAAVRAAGAAGDGVAAGRFPAAAHRPVHARARAGGVGAGGGRARGARPALDSRPVAAGLAGARAGEGPHALVGGRGGRSGRRRLRRRSGGLPFAVHHRDARPGVLFPVRGMDLPARVAADPAGSRGLRRFAQQPARLQQLRLLPGRGQRRAAVHGRAADGAVGRPVGRRRERGPGSQPPCWGPRRCSPSAA